MVEYWLDRFDTHPLEVHRNADGFIQLKDTGDPLVDKWEEKIARGEEPDLWEAFSPEAREELNRVRQKAAAVQVRGGFTMADTVERVSRDARAQGVVEPGGNVMKDKLKRSLGTFGDGSE